MKSWIRVFLLVAVMETSFSVLSPSATKADDYWDGYWNWYDNTYRPYYYRQYNSPRYDRNYGYGRQYYNYPGDRYYNYGGDRYYGTPNFGYRDGGAGGGTVRVGPLRFGWW